MRIARGAFADTGPREMTYRLPREPTATRRPTPMRRLRYEHVRQSRRLPLATKGSVYRPLCCRRLTTQETLAQRTSTWKLWAVAPSLVIVADHPGRPVSLMKSEELTARR